MNKEWKQQLLRCKWSLYLQHGFQFKNWLTMTHETIARKDILEALQDPDTRKSAERAIESYKHKIAEIEELLKESQL